MIIEQAIEAFRQCAHRAVNSQNTADCTISLQPGKRYIRVVKTRHGQNSAYAFIEPATGDVFKCDGWKAPAKHARCNVLRPDGFTPEGEAFWHAAGPFSMAYLR